MIKHWACLLLLTTSDKLYFLFYCKKLFVMSDSQLPDSEVQTVQCSECSVTYNLAYLKTPADPNTTIHQWKA